MSFLASHVGAVQIVLLLAAIGFGIAAVVTFGRWFFNHRDSDDYPLWVPIVLAVITAMFLVLRSIAPSFLASFEYHEPVCTCTTQCTTETVNPDCPVCSAKGADLTACIGTPPASDPEPEYEDGYLLPVSLTEDQMQAFLDKVDLTITKRSLAGDNRTARNAAVAKYAAEHKHTPFQEPVNYPIVEWFPEFEQLRNKNLTLDQRLELTEKFFDALDQEMASNIPFGIMILEDMKELPYVYKYNADWIDGNLAIINQFYAGTYQQPTDEASAKLELAKIPTLDTTKFVGLDYLVVSQNNGLNDTRMAREEWGRLCAMMSSALRTYAFRSSGAMVVTRTADLSWCNTNVAQDSLVRMVVDEKVDNRDWLMLTVSAKQIDPEDKLDAEWSLIGLNPEDSRIGNFTPNTPDPDPEKETETPPDTKPTTYKLTIYYKYADGTKAADTHTETLKNGKSYSVTSPTITGYTPDRTTVSGKINGGNVTVTVTYTKNPPTRVTDYQLSIAYVYEDGSKAFDTYTERLKPNDPYYRESPTKTGYTPDKAVVSGTMGNQDIYVTVTYKPNEHKLTIYYEYENGRTAASTHTEWLSHGESYRVTSPTVRGYRPDQRVVSGTMYDRDITVTVVYERVYTLTIKYVYSTGGRAAPTYEEEYTYDEYYSVDSPDIDGWTPSQSVVRGRMPANNKTVTVTYTKKDVPFDGHGTKDPSTDGSNTGDANIGGGDNKHTDGEGLKQDDKVVETDYPPKGSDTTTSKDPIKANDSNDDSTGLGGKDHQVQDPNGGNTQNGDPPVKDSIQTVTGTTGTNEQTGQQEDPSSQGAQNQGVNAGW